MSKSDHLCENSFLNTGTRPGITGPDLKSVPLLIGLENQYHGPDQLGISNTNIDAELFMNRK